MSAENEILSETAEAVGRATRIANAEAAIEDAVAALFAAAYTLRLEKAYQLEYDTKGALLNMLMQDREHLRKGFGVKP